MKKKLVIAALSLLFVLPFSSETSYSQVVDNKQFKVSSLAEVKLPEVERQQQSVPEANIVMEATAYDLSVRCCGKFYSNPSRGITKDGYNLNNKSHNQAWTVSSNKFSMGTKLKIIFPKSHKKYEGVYVVHDTGNFKNSVLDVYIGDFGERVGQETINFGRVNVKVLVLES